MRIGLQALEGVAACTIIFFGLFWFIRPSSNVEPITVIAGGIILLVDWVRRRRPEDPIKALPWQPQPSSSVEDKEPPPRSEYLPRSVGSRALFAQRFGYAFPGIRDVTWYEGAAAVARLSILLGEPLRYGPEDGYPFWWWRGGNLQIQSFEQVDKHTVLMNWDELKVRRVAAVPNADYRRCWVYVETNAMPATGLYEPLDEEALKERIRIFGYAWEEYALFRGQLIRREEYDDGAAVIAGSVVRLKGEAELRVRYLTPYNFVIAPIASAFNNNSFDHELKDTLNGLLAGSVDLASLANRVEKLPLPNRFEE